MAPQQWCFFAELAEQAAGRIGRPMALPQSWHFAVSQDQLGSLPERIGPLTALQQLGLFAEPAEQFAGEYRPAHGAATVVNRRRTS